MNLEAFKIYANNYKDVRFGEVDIYQEKNTMQLFMVKTKEFKDPEEFKNNVLYYQTRKKFKNPYLWIMQDLFIDRENQTIQTRFVYPNEDLFEYADFLKKPEGLITFLIDALKALNVIEKNLFIHGCMKPESFFYSHEKESFVLIDRIFDVNIYYQNIIIDQMLNGEHIYISPELFEGILSKKQVNATVYQQDTFSLGMVVAGVLLEEEVIQQVYDIQNQEFSHSSLANVKQLIRQQIKGKFKLLADFICQILLNENPMRDLPSQALNILKRIKVEIESWKLDSFTQSDKKIKDTQRESKERSFKELGQPSKNLKITKMSFRNDQQSEDSLERDHSEEERLESQNILTGSNFHDKKNENQLKSDTLRNSNFSFNYEEDELGLSQEEIFNKMVGANPDIGQNDFNKIIGETLSNKNENQSERNLNFLENFQNIRMPDTENKDFDGNQDLEFEKHGNDFQAQYSPNNRITFNSSNQDNIMFKFEDQDEMEGANYFYDRQDQSLGKQGFDKKMAQEEVVFEEYEQKRVVQGDQSEFQDFQLKKDSLSGTFSGINSLKQITEQMSQREVISPHIQEEKQKNLQGDQKNSQQNQEGECQKGGAQQERSSQDHFVSYSLGSQQLIEEGIETGLFQKNLNEKEEHDMNYMADSEDIILGSKNYSHFTEKLVYSLQMTLEYNAYLTFCEKNQLNQISIEFFEENKLQFKQIKAEFMTSTETYKKEIQQNSEEQNRELFKEIFPIQMEGTFKKFLLEKFIQQIIQQKCSMISQADLIVFEQLDNDSGYLEEDTDQNVDKKYSEITNLQRTNSFESMREDAGYQQLLENDFRDNYNLNSIKSLKRVQELIEMNQDKIDQSPKTYFPNIFEQLLGRNDEQKLNQKYNSQREVASSEKLVVGSLRDLVLNHQDLKERNQSSFRFDPYVEDQGDFAKGFNQVKIDQKVIISFRKENQNEFQSHQIGQNNSSDQNSGPQSETLKEVLEAGESSLRRDFPDQITKSQIDFLSSEGYGLLKIDSGNLIDLKKEDSTQVFNLLQQTNQDIPLRQDELQASHGQSKLVDVQNSENYPVMNTYESPSLNNDQEINNEKNDLHHIEPTYDQSDLVQGESIQQPSAVHDNLVNPQSVKNLKPNKEIAVLNLSQENSPEENEESQLTVKRQRQNDELQESYPISEEQKTLLGRIDSQTGNQNSFVFFEKNTFDPQSQEQRFFQKQNSPKAELDSEFIKEALEDQNLKQTDFQEAAQNQLIQRLKSANYDFQREQFQQGHYVGTDEVLRIVEALESLHRQKEQEMQKTIESLLNKKSPTEIQESQQGLLQRKKVIEPLKKSLFVSHVYGQLEQRRIPKARNLRQTNKIKILECLKPRIDRQTQVDKEVQKDDEEFIMLLEEQRNEKKTQQMIGSTKLIFTQDSTVKQKLRILMIQQVSRMLLSLKEEKILKQEPVRQVQSFKQLSNLKQKRFLQSSHVKISEQYKIKNEAKPRDRVDFRIIEIQQRRVIQPQVQKLTKEVQIQCQLQSIPIITYQGTKTGKQTVSLHNEKTNERNSHLKNQILRTQQEESYNKNPKAEFTSTSPKDKTVFDPFSISKSPILLTMKQEVLVSNIFPQKFEGNEFDDSLKNNQMSSNSLVNELPQITEPINLTALSTQNIINESITVNNDQEQNKKHDFISSKIQSEKHVGRKIASGEVKLEDLEQKFKKKWVNQQTNKHFPIKEMNYLPIKDRTSKVIHKGLEKSITVQTPVIQRQAQETGNNQTTQRQQKSKSPLRYTKFTLDEFEKFGVNSEGKFVIPSPKINREVIGDIKEYEERKTGNKSPTVRRQLNENSFMFKTGQQFQFNPDETQELKSYYQSQVLVKEPKGKDHSLVRKVVKIEDTQSCDRFGKQVQDVQLFQAFIFFPWI